MTVTLNFGVIELPYSFDPPTPPSKPPKKGSKPRRRSPPPSVTTGDVAGWLEDKYHVMEIFYQQNQDAIIRELESGVEAHMENMLMGAPMSANVFAGACSSIENMFKGFLSEDMFAGLGYPGVPTQAALKGVNKRLKKKRGAPRPSFIDTGLYQSSFKVWSPEG